MEKPSREAIILPPAFELYRGALEWGVPGLTDEDYALIAPLAPVAEAWMDSLDTAFRNGGRGSEIAQPGDIAGAIANSGLAWRITANPNIPKREAAHPADEIMAALNQDRQFPDRRRAYQRDQDPINFLLMQSRLIVVTAREIAKHYRET